MVNLRLSDDSGAWLGRARITLLGNLPHVLLVNALLHHRKSSFIKQIYSLSYPERRQ